MLSLSLQADWEKPDCKVNSRPTSLPWPVVRARWRIVKASEHSYQLISSWHWMLFKDIQSPPLKDRVTNEPIFQHYASRNAFQSTWQNETPSQNFNESWITRVKLCMTMMIFQLKVAPAEYTMVNIHCDSLSYIIFIE